jgi:hypothetical protein
MRWFAPFLLLALGACAQPGPAFYGVAPVPVTVGQSRFDVRIVGRHAQAIRLSREWAPRTASVAPRAAAAIAAASGCDVPRLWGDQAMIEALLVCGPDASRRRGTARAYECRTVPTHRRWTELACRPRGGSYDRYFSMKTELGASG